MSDEQFQKLHWTITGEFVTRMARDWVLERRWDDSIRWLKDSLIGVEYNHIMAILEGRAKLVGDSHAGIFLEEENPEDAKEYIDGYMFLYGGIYKRYENHYQPYAVVRDYGPTDIVVDKPWNLRESNLHHKNRAMFYAYHPSTDECFLLHYSKVSGPIEMNILWERVDKPPLWVKTFSEPQEALDAFLKYHQNLTVTGYSATFPGGRGDNFIAPSTWLKKRLNKEEQKKLDETEEERYIKEVEELRAEILAKSIECIILNVDGLEYRVPREPFENWALRRTSGHHLAMPWIPVSPPAFKMYGDDPYHTDWVIGAGLPADEIYHKHDAINKAAYQELLRIQIEKLNFKCAVLNGTGKVHGVVVHPVKDQRVDADSIIVIPNASADYYISMLTACENGKGAVITETGGALCHLANQARELGARIIQIPEALTRFPVRTKLIVNCDIGEVHISEATDNFIGAI